MPKREIEKERKCVVCSSKEKKDIEHYMMGNYWQNGLWENSKAIFKTLPHIIHPLPNECSIYIAPSVYPHITQYCSSLLLVLQQLLPHFG